MPFLVAGILVLCLAACQAPSLNPLALPTDKVTLPAFEGRWADAKHKHMLVVSPPQEFRYEAAMTSTERSVTWRYEAKLVKLGGTLFADLLLKSASEHYDGCIGCIPAHTFWKLNLADNTLKPQYLDGSWLNKHLNTNPKAIAHVWTAAEDEKIAILTAPTAALRAFVTQAAGAKDAFSDWESLHRCEH